MVGLDRRKLCFVNIFCYAKRGPLYIFIACGDNSISNLVISNIQLARYTLKGICKIEVARKTYYKRGLGRSKGSQEIPQKLSETVELTRKTKLKGYTGRSN